MTRALILLVFTSCGPAGAPAAVFFPAAEGVHPRERGGAMTAACGQRQGLLLETPSEVTRACSDGRCAVEVPIKLTNCRPSSTDVRRIVIEQQGSEESVGGIVSTFEFERPRISEGTSRQWTVPLAYVGAFRIVVHSEGESVVRPLIVHSELRAGAMADCTACNGIWGPMGSAQVEMCSCATGDAGKRCRSRTDCEGECLYVGAVRVSPPDGEPACTAWVREGECSDRQLVFGCRRFLLVPNYSCEQPTTGPRHCME